MATRTSQSHASGSLSLSSGPSRVSGTMPGLPGSGAYPLPPSSSSSTSASAFTNSSAASSSTHNGYGPAAPGLMRQGSSMSVDSPVVTASVVNKGASASASLYQNCLTAMAMMKRVPGFEEGPWIPLSTGLEELEPTTPGTGHTSTQLDPVTQMLHILRLGSSLCYLFNAISFEPRTPPYLDALPPLPQGKTWDNIAQLRVNMTPNRNDLQDCKKSTAHFVMAVGSELGWGRPDDVDKGNGEMFMVKMLYDQNTNATVKVVSNVLRLLNLLAALGVLKPPNPDDDSALNNATGTQLDDRGKVVQEILESERKYVQHLEVLQNYQRALTQSETLPANQIRSLFMNLDALVDFQRRFLIGVEANAALPAEEQRFGYLFVTLEEHFTCYEPFCANFAAASQLAQDEIQALSTKSDILDPNYELPTLLIKPVQRICKYPLLLTQLLKTTPKTSRWYQEIKEGLAAITRVTDGVNETTRQRENELAVNELRERVEDWKSHDVRQFGPLVLEDMFMVIKNDSEREYHVYLFERIILCCKEVGGTKADKKNSKSNSILKKPAPARKKTTLQLKGRIFINNVLSATQPPRTSSSGTYLLQVTWRGDTNEEHFSLKCRTEEQLKKWQTSINRAVEDSTDRRRRQVAHLSASSRGRLNSPLSQFPNTPLSELGPSTPLGFPTPGSNGYHPYSARNFDEEEESIYRNDDGSGTVRARSHGGHRSLPAGERTPNGQAQRPRAQTDDTGANWRAQTPASRIPPLPPPSESGTVSPHTSQAPSLRSSGGSTRNLRHKQSHEWGSAGFTRMDGGTERPPPIARQASQASLPSHQQYGQAQPPTLRNRSASSPNIYQVEGGMAHSEQWGHVPQIPTHHIDPRTHGARLNGRTKRESDSSIGTDRSSDDSALSQARTGTAASSPASTTKPSSLPGSHVNGRYSNGAPAPAPANLSSSVRFKLRSGEDTYVIVALPTISFNELQEKVIRKLRNCGVAKDGEVRMRYEDEEGDKILMSADDDVLMAIDFLRQNSVGQPQPPALTLYVD